MKPVLFIVVLISDTWTMVDYNIKRYAERIHENGIEVKIDFNKHEIFTPMVRCRFISGVAYYNRPYMLSGLKATEVFGFTATDTDRYRWGGREDQFTGDFMQYILWMNQAKVVEKDSDKGSEDA